MRSGKQESYPYSLSRWTDLPAAKWSWFEAQLDQGWMTAFDPKTGMPDRWSLKLEDVFGLIFWTRDPTNLVKSVDRLKGYPLVIHYTLTGWVEVEKRTPSIEEGLEILGSAVEAFGPEQVIWRFSPVPTVPDVLDRFERIAEGVHKLGIQTAFVSFLQENDMIAETRSARVRKELLKQLAGRTDLEVRLCAEDSTLPPQAHVSSFIAREGEKAYPVRYDFPNKGASPWGPRNLARGICESGRRFIPLTQGVPYPPSEGCGCALAVDPFTINESCTFGCRYCYAADQTTAPKKRNTTKGSLKVLP